MNFCWNYCREQQREGGWGTAAGLTSQTLVAEAKKWFDLSQVLGQWHPEEHQWHRGEDNSISSPANMGQDSEFTEKYRLTHPHCISTQRSPVRDIKSRGWEHLLCTPTCRALHPPCPPWSGTLSWDPSSWLLKAFPYVHFLLLQRCSYRFLFLQLLRSKSRALNSQHCFLTLFINRANTTTDQSLWKSFFLDSFFIVFWPKAKKFGLWEAWLEGILCDLNVMCSLKAKIWHTGEGRDKKNTSLNSWS